MPSLCEAHRHHAEYNKSFLEGTDHLYMQGGKSLKQVLTSFDLEWHNIQARQQRVIEASKDDDKLKLCSEFATAGIYCNDIR